MSGDVHVRFSEGVGVRSRCATHLVVLCRTLEEAETALETIRRWMAEEGLTLHPEKTCLVSMDEDGNSFDFLGYRFKRHKGRDYRFVRTKSLKKLRESVRLHTRRNNGHSLATIIDKVNPVLRGWFEYFKHCHRTEFPQIDGWVRMRLRSILRKRRKGRGRGGGLDHYRWPNVYFTERGLFNLTAARAEAVQSRAG